MSRIMEMAKDLGGAIGRTDEYHALKRTIDSTEDDPELSEMQKGLAFCATLWLWSKNWKVAIKDEEDEKG